MPFKCLKKRKKYHKEYHKKWYSLNKKNRIKQIRKYKEKNIYKNRSYILKYYNTEKGFFRSMYTKMLKSKHGCDFKSFKEFFKCWIDQKKKYGMRCPYLDIEMTRIRGVNKFGERKIFTDNNISRERILSDKPYSKKNLIFVCWKANKKKSNITPKIAKKFLKIVEERYGVNKC